MDLMSLIFQFEDLVQMLVPFQANDKQLGWTLFCRKDTEKIKIINKGETR